MNRRLLRLLKEKGQTSTEYLLIMVVSITIGMTMKKKLEEFVLTNPNSLLSQQISKLNGSFGGGRYQSFTLQKIN